VSGQSSAAGAAVDEPLVQDVELLANRTLEAAEAGLRRAVLDEGLRYTFYLLTQIVLAAREPDWQDRLDRVGIQIDAESDLFDLTVGLQSAIDDHVERGGGATDLSEMAQRAAGEAIAQLAGPRANTLFGDPDDLRLAMRSLSSREGFAELGRRFFGQFMTRYLNFYLSRATAAETGGARLAHLGDVAAVNSALEEHCFQSARVVRDFCGQWYSATEFRQGITEENTTGFMSVALDKLRAELRQQRTEA
jgi:hypothetical protein